MDATSTAAAARRVDFRKLEILLLIPPVVNRPGGTFGQAQVALPVVPQPAAVEVKANHRHRPDRAPLGRQRHNSAAGTDRGAAITLIVAAAEREIGRRGSNVPLPPRGTKHLLRLGMEKNK